MALFLVVRNYMFVKVGAGFIFHNSRLSADVNVKYPFASFSTPLVIYKPSSLRRSHFHAFFSHIP